MLHTVNVTLLGLLSHGFLRAYLILLYYQIDIYCLYGKDRMSQAGGGLLLYICDCFKSVVNETLTNSDFDESL